MRAVSRELELKLELSEEALERVRARTASKDLAAGQPSTRTLRSIYYDTDDHRLRSHGFSLRLRPMGAQWVQTVKAGPRVRAGVSSSVEAEILIDDFEPRVACIPDRDIRKRVRAAVGKAFLKPVFETVVERTVQNVRAPSGAEIEIAFDKGSVRADGTDRSLCEVELELKSGSPDALVTVAQSLLGGEPVQLASMSKAERGYELASERRPEELRPVVATMPRISAGDTGAQAMQRVADCLAGQILGNWRFLLQSDDPEGIHQLRIGLRRLRSALKALRPVLDGERAISLAKSARELANMLGELRDLDVLATDVVGRIPGDRAGLSLLGEALQSARASRRDSVCSRLASPEWNQLQLSLAMLPQSFAPGGDLAASMPRKPIKALIDKALARQWRRLADQGRRIRKLGVTERHELRKDLKTLRYTSELFATLYPKAEVRKLVRNMRHLQDILGYLNDVALAERLTSLGTNGAGRDVELQRAAGFVIGWHSARAEAAWKGANKAWETLEEAPRFWK